ncbi:hypothetical protein EROM_061310 [Encephalitozoon romaleae SJ-2008]|uniref:Polyprenol reductase n=1 Tax=Encephalitozoon romaleae (strain SJ-2008) TaxID=1178016 RepID=I6ZU88_ENCRO|nr:hypothetical protein EROM_061310 [Encephalitozoon romaleae SJ-2008]AFN83221.1 hypothetical protein EROM_061310 [Encephalitozoon romaleae SJ-2008]
MFVLIETLYFALLPVVTVASHIFINDLTRHGHIPEGMTKNNYQYFYAYGVILSLLLPVKNIYPFHLGRRFIETKVLKYSDRSKMNLLQFIHGLVYYTFVCMHLRDKAISNKGVFMLLNALQSVSHYFVFIRKTAGYSHYVVEVVIYAFIYCEVGTIQMLFNLLYVLSFVLSTIRNRRILREKPRENIF